MSNKAERFLLFFLLCVVTAGFVANAAFLYSKITILVPDFGGVYREGVLGAFRNIDPYHAVSDADKFAFKLEFSSLYVYDKASGLVPDMAMGAPVRISEGKYRVALNRDIYFHDGSLFDADDVVYSIDLQKSSDKKTTFAKSWLSSSVLKEDQFNVVFVFPTDSIGHLYNLTLPIVSSTSLESKIGSGPYRMTKKAVGENGDITSLAFVAFRSNKSNSYIDTVILNTYSSSDDLFMAYKIGNIDGFVMTGFDSDSGYFDPTEGLSTLDQTQVMFLNNKRMSFDRRFAIYNALKANRGLIDPSFAYLVPVYSFYGSDTSARRFGLQDFSFDMAFINDTYWAKLATNIKDVLSAYNINVRLYPINKIEVASVIASRQYDAVLFTYQDAPGVDPFPLWHSSEGYAGSNLSSVDDSEVDRLVVAIKTAETEEERSFNLNELSKRLDERAVAYPLYKNVYYYQVGDDINAAYNNLVELSDRAKLLPLWYINTKRELYNPFF